MLSVPGSTPISCMKSANMSVLTTEAAELRVIVERSSPNAAIPASGSDVHAEAREHQCQARGLRTPASRRGT